MHDTSILSVRGKSGEKHPTDICSECSLLSIFVDDVINAILCTVNNQDSPVLQDTAIRWLRIDTFIGRVIILKIVYRIHILTNNPSIIKFKMRELERQITTSHNNFLFAIPTSGSLFKENRSILVGKLHNRPVFAQFLHVRSPLHAGVDHFTNFRARSIWPFFTI